MNQQPSVKVLFVCMGNICRSPTADGIFTKLVEEADLSKYIKIESAGTIGYHAGNNPDQRACAMARSRGVDISALVARKVTAADYIEQDYILAMDYNNMQGITLECPEQFMDKLDLLLRFHPDKSLQEVPDPYYGGNSGFETVYEMIELACINLLQHIIKGSESIKKLN